MKKLRLVAIALVWSLCCVTRIFAQQTYTVTIDTTAVKGQAGSVVLDLAHLNAFDNSATITNFTNGATTSNETIGTGDGVTVTFNHTLAQPPVGPKSLVINYTLSGFPEQATDDGAGNIVGFFNISSGTIDYSTGALSITFFTPPDNATAITANYIGGGSGGVNGLPITQGGLVTGDIILGSNPAPFTTMDESFLGTAFFFTELQLPFTSFGTSLSFSLSLSQSTDGVSPPDEFAFFVLNSAGQTLTPSADPLLADALFTICIDGTPTGLFNAYNPAMFVAPGAINIALAVPPPAGSIVNVVAANSSGLGGQNVNGGSFSIQNNATSAITINSIVIAETTPATFSNLALNASSSGTPVGSATAMPGSTSTFNFSPGLSIAPSATLDFAVVATINSGANSVSTQTLNIVSGTGSTGAVAFGGLPASLGMVTGGVVASPTPTATPTPTPMTTPTPTPTVTPTPTTLTGSPATLNFKNVDATSSSKTKELTLNNKGTATAQIGQIVSPASFALSDDLCSNTTLAVKKKCTIDLAFVPTAPGAVSEALMIPYNGTSPSETLNGNGLAVTLSAPKSVTLPSTAAGTTGKAKKVTIKNKSDATVTLGTASLSANFTFASGGDACTGATLAHDTGKCVATLEFMPVAGSSGPLTGTLSYPFSYGTNSGNLSVPLSGKVK
jgi:hypothetical protein